MTSIALSEGQPLPPLCARCGCETDGLAKVARGHRRGGDSIAIKIFLILLGPIWSWFIPRGGVRRSVRIDLPMCDGCLRMGMPEPQHVDLESVRMTFLVHREFAEGIKDAPPG